MILHGWKTRVLLLSAIVGVACYLALVGVFGIQARPAHKMTVPPMFQPGLYTIDETGAEGAQHRLALIRARNRMDESGMITIIGETRESKGTWQVENGLLDAFLQGPVDNKSQEVRHMHVQLRFTPHGVVGQGRDVVLGHGTPGVTLITSIENYHLTGQFQHAETMTIPDVALFVGAERKEKDASVVE